MTQKDMGARVKVKVKATGEIKEVARGIYSPYQYVDNEGTIYTENDVEELPGDDGAIFFDPTIDYWTRLEHQAAIAAMQGVLANADLLFSLCKDRGDCPVKVVAIEFANACAHVLVEKYKKEEK